MTRVTGSYAISTTLGESVRAFVPHPLPPSDPALDLASFVDLNRQAELALARLSGVVVEPGAICGLAAVQRHPQGGLAHLANRKHRPR